jgi:hypothetical protein
VAAETDRQLKPGGGQAGVLDGLGAGLGVGLGVGLECGLGLGDGLCEPDGVGDVPGTPCLPDAPGGGVCPEAPPWWVDWPRCW